MWSNVVHLKNDALDALEPQFLKGCVTETCNPTNVPPGQLRAVPVNDERGRLSAIKFIGECFTRMLGRPGRRVTSFRTDQGYVDGNGRPLR